MSVYLTISVSVERYISVVYPLLSIRLHSQTSYLKLALPAILFAIIFTLPTYFMLDNSCEKVGISKSLGRLLALLDLSICEEYTTHIISVSYINIFSEIGGGEILLFL